MAVQRSPFCSTVAGASWIDRFQCSSVLRFTRLSNQVERMNSWLGSDRLKYYFAVNNRYVVNKIKIVLFPFTNKV